ncbi:Na-translocating system protein MpsC family protein [Paenibacillus sp. CAA11]|uniref:Na-translocating system protein MpsC family protein n=1 Tax=Paenibacillus sp. CAA11 TaxID=1532905 RepID=UPI001F4732F1|nr:Na-translocating system protein MpsC family protein [Paenibacillus sp. CAA11]
MITTAGEFKQDLLRIYNAINKKIFNVGVKQQKVDFVGNKIVIVSTNSRVPVLKLLDANHPLSTRQLDHLLFQVFKQEIKQVLKEQFQLNIVTILKDYDAETELSGTIIFLERDIECYLNEPSELR